MTRVFLLTAAVVCAVLSAGLLFRWGFWIFEEPEWQADALGWLALAVASFACSFHPLIAALDEAITRRRA